MTYQDLLLDFGVCHFLGREALVATNGQFNPSYAINKECRQLGNFGI
ncbi:MAG: hypothetical protein ACTS85_04010 [Arsenophonus sp. NC-PG7-MAG3]